MQQLLENSNLLSCSHAVMTEELVSTLIQYKMYQDFTDKDFAKIASSVLSYVTSRCNDETLQPSYKLFLFMKIEFAFNIALGVKRAVVLTEDEVDGMLDIPIEEFQDAQIDEEFVKKINNER